MLYLNSNDIRVLGTDWYEILDVTRNAVESVYREQYRQPVKPYLRYKDLANRIIAMPAYLGGNNECAGIKWIASFPKNIDQGMQRAHSVTILNEVDTGKPKCMLNTTSVSGIRTAGVSGVVVKKYLEHCTNRADRLDIGIIGLGPIGYLHLSMLTSIMQEQLGNIYLYDIRKIDESIIPKEIKSKVRICDSWEEVYSKADIFVTCTTSSKGYIDSAPKSGSLQLNVSLRDYLPSCREYMDFIVVDDWDEICRENTDIEVMHKTIKLSKADTYSLAEFTCEPTLVNAYKRGNVIMFNAMGMAVFDVAVGNYYFEKAVLLKEGMFLAD